MDEVTQFNIEGKVVYHNLPGIYQPLQEIVTLCRGGDYQVHIFPHGHIFLSGIENIVHQEESMPKEKYIETPTTNNGLEID